MAVIERGDSRHPRRDNGTRSRAAKVVRNVIALFTVLLFSRIAAAEDYVRVLPHYYDIDPGLTIVKPSVSISRDLSLDTNLSARFTLDQVKTGSSGVDAVSSASQFSGSSHSGENLETRKEVSVSVTHTLKDWKVDAGYLVSEEEDYRSQAPSIGVARDFFQRNTTVALGYARNFDRVSGSFMVDPRDKNVDNYAVSISQVLTPETLAQASYTLQVAKGFMGTGNRKVILVNGAEMDEFLPEERTREALAVRVARWLFTEGSVQLGYRHYRDNWKIGSDTYQVQIYQYIAENLLARGEYRRYVQDAAFFVKDSYTGEERYLTSANSLKGFSSDLYGVKIVYTLRRPRNLDLEAEYERYAQSIGVEGNIFMLGARFSF